MKKVIIATLVLTVALFGVASAVAGNDHGGGHQPVTLCHKPGTPAEHTITVDDNAQVLGHLAHGDYLGPCRETPPPPETDVCPNIEGTQAAVPEGMVIDDNGDCVAEDTTPETPPVETPPGGDNPGGSAGHDCTFVGADKDGGVDAYGGTNDDCAPFPAQTVVEQPGSTPICPITVQTVVKQVPKLVVKWRTKLVKKVVYRTKVKVVYRTRVVVKRVSVPVFPDVPGLHKNGVEGNG